MNLNDDPLLDRQVKYFITKGECLTCGRRNAKSNHKLQLSGLHIYKDHCKFELDAESKFLLVTALEEKANEHVRINGKCLKPNETTTIKPNDRVAIGPNVVFLFKHTEYEREASMKDTKDEPITLDYALEEIENAQDNEGEQQAKVQRDNIVRLQKEHEQQMMADLNKEFEEREKAAKAEIENINSKIKEISEEDEQKKELQKQKEQKEQEMREAVGEKIKRVVAENIRQHNLNFLNKKTEEELIKLLPKIKEANQIGIELGRNVYFTIKTLRQLDPNTGKALG